MNLFDADLRGTDKDLNETSCCRAERKLKLLIQLFAGGEGRYAMHRENKSSLKFLLCEHKSRLWL